MVDVNQFENLGDCLKACLNTYKKAHPRLSDVQVSKRLDVPRSTMGRILNGEVDKPRLENAVSIVNSVCEPEETQKFIKRFYPDSENRFSKVYAGNLGATFVPVEVEALFQNPQTYELMMMASSQCGLSFEKARLEFGERGKKTLERLEELKLLKFENGHFFFNESLNATQETVHKLVLNLLTNSYDLDNFGPARNMLTLQYESVDKEKVLPKLRAIIDRARAETRELFTDPDNKGQDVVWVTFAGDTLGPHGHTVKDIGRQGELQ